MTKSCSASTSSLGNSKFVLSVASRSWFSVDAMSMKVPVDLRFGPFAAGFFFRFCASFDFEVISEGLLPPPRSESRPLGPQLSMAGGGPESSACRRLPTLLSGAASLKISHIVIDGGWLNKSTLCDFWRRISPILSFKRLLRSLDAPSRSCGDIGLSWWPS